MNRTKAAQLGAEAVAISQQGWYVNRRGDRVSIAEAVAACLAGTELVRPADWRSIHRRAGDAATAAGRNAPVVEVTDETTLAAAARLAAGGAGDVLALNFASAKNPGGGFLGGSRAQEESIARASALYPSLLTQRAYYDANRSTPGTLYTDHAIYSPRVSVFRADNGDLLDQPFEASVFTMPAPNVRQMTPSQAADGRAAEAIAKRIGHVLAFAAARGYRTLVLGAWGCGAFRNDPRTVAGLFAEAMAGPYAACFDRVTFAVFDMLEGQPVLSAFRDALTPVSERYAANACGEQTRMGSAVEASEWRKGAGGYEADGDVRGPGGVFAPDVVRRSSPSGSSRRTAQTRREQTNELGGELAMTAIDYKPMLAAAVDAARAAGDILRAEFLRPGGPRGSAGTCPADADAERLIRAKLSAAFPAFGWLAEETGGATAGTDLGGHAWVVDPNDGTDPFLSGMRGSSVSIGLLRAGVPVLGVVYAYAAAGFPDGDLIAWAEGCGPLTRNGTAVDRPPLADRLTAQHTVLLSQNADHASAANARLSAPARFRAVPGIAYRLALAAAGDGEAAHSLSGPRAWDVAAGHALLRGVGGDLVDERGVSIKYPADGRSVAGRCFGGSAAVARELAGRPWDAVFARETVTERFGLTRPRRDAVCPDARLLDRAIGCLIGQIAGDSLGGLVEFQPAGAVARKHPAGVRELADGGHWDILAGQPTDDSEMALMLARSIVAAGTYDPAAALAAYAHWYESPPFDIGGTTSQALSAAASAIAAGRDPLAAVAAAASQGSQANGALMRVSPLAVLAHAAPVPQAVAWARADAALTHPHEVCRDANALFVATVAYAIRTGAAPEGVYAFARRTAEEQKLHADVRTWLADAEAGPPGDFQHQMGWVRIAFQNAFYQLLTAKTPQDGMTDTIGRGGDTDTNAAIAGALLGAAHGVSAMPPRYVDRVLTCRPIAKVAAGRRPRPRDFWPVDVMHLAERLVVLGQRHAAKGLQ